MPTGSGPADDAEQRRHEWAVSLRQAFLPGLPAMTPDHGGYRHWLCVADRAIELADQSHGEVAR